MELFIKDPLVVELFIKDNKLIILAEKALKTEDRSSGGVEARGEHILVGVQVKGW